MIILRHDFEDALRRSHRPLFSVVALYIDCKYRYLTLGCNICGILIRYQSDYCCNVQCYYNIHCTCICNNTAGMLIGNKRELVTLMLRFGDRISAYSYVFIGIVTWITILPRVFHACFFIIRNYIKAYTDQVVCHRHFAQVTGFIRLYLYHIIAFYGPAVHGYTAIDILMFPKVLEMASFQMELN